MLRPALGCLLAPALISQAPVLDADQFTAKVLDHVARAFPAFKVTRKGPLTLEVRKDEANRGDLNLDNGYTEYRQAPERLEGILARYAGALKEVLGETPKPTPDRIVLLVRPTPMLQEAQRAAKAGAGPVFDSFGDDLSLVYALDLANTVKYLNANEVAALGVKREDLRAKAAYNLAVLVGSPQIAQQQGFLMVLAKDGYETSLAAVPEFLQAIKGLVKGELVLAFPTRDLFLVTGSGSPEGIQAVRAVAAKAFREGDHALSPHLYRMDQGKLVRLPAVATP
jgi:uncharacterized protein YtpQ (UPF0354 family)